jgi:hypothetical protein
MSDPKCPREDCPLGLETVEDSTDDDCGRCHKCKTLQTRDQSLTHRPHSIDSTSRSANATSREPNTTTLTSAPGTIENFRIDPGIYRGLARSLNHVVFLLSFTDQQATVPGNEPCDPRKV